MVETTVYFSAMCITIFHCMQIILREPLTGCRQCWFQHFGDETFDLLLNQGVIIATSPVVLR